MSQISIVCAFLVGLLLLPALHVANVLLGLLVRRSLRNRLRRLSKGHLVLTYDDGPGERLQSRLLKLFAEQQAHATFYLLGLRAEGRGERVQELLEQGHEVGSHAFAHIDAIAAAPWTVRVDHDHAKMAFANLGLRPTSYRPPYGRMTWTGFRRLDAESLPVAMWTHASGDTYRRRPSVNEVVDAVARDGGGVVLLHSHDRTNDAACEDFVLKVTEALLQMAKDKGLRITRFCDLIDTK
jgi:peptidoglycan/xylan/chitin deacetylase (PgdA/CDA1 family)